MGHLDPLTLVGTGTTNGPVFPGETADLHLAVKNPNAFPVTITGVAPSGTTIVTGGNGCTATNSALTVNSAALAITVPATATTYPITIPNGVSMGTGSYTGCQTATFHIPLNVTVRS